jgi:hypothetical protein
MEVGCVGRRFRFVVRKERILCELLKTSELALANEPGEATTTQKLCYLFFSDVFLFPCQRLYALKDPCP